MAVTTDLDESSTPSDGQPGHQDPPDRGSPSDAPTPPRDESWWARIDLWVGLLVLAACCAFIFVQLEPSLLFRNTTPAGGDTAAHVWWPAYLRDHLLPWRLSGWSPDFYGGFPAGQFYFPIPALTIVGLDVVFPYNIAFKLGTVVGPVLLPIGAYVFARGLRLPRPSPAAFAVAATGFLFFTGDPGTSSLAQGIAFNQHIAGGTLASTLAGEFSYTMALAFALAFLGTLAASLRNGRRMWIPALLFALVIMSHLVVAIFAAVGALVVWIAAGPITTLKRAAAIAAVGGLLTAVWTVPLLAVLGYTTDMRYTPITQYGDYLFPSYLFGFQSLWPWEWGATVLIGAALIGGLVGRRRGTLVVVVITACSGLMFRFWEDVQATPAWNLRFLPFWYLGIFLLMGLGVAETIRGGAWVARRTAEREESRTPPRLIASVVAGVLTVVLAVGALYAFNDNKDFIPYWARWNYRGYEDTTGDGATPAKQYDEYRAFIDAASQLPPGRLLWEGNSQLNVYGSPLALMLLPYWTDGRISSNEGVYYEASASTPYHFMATAALAAAGNSSGAVRGVPYRTQADFGLGVQWLQTLGIRYLAVHADATKTLADADPRLRLVATSPDFDKAQPLGWSIYRVQDSELVSPLENQPVVVDEFSSRDEAACLQRLEDLGLDPKDLRIHEWQDCIAVPWFNDPEALDRVLVDDGPAAWQHSGTEAARKQPKEPLPTVDVTNVHRTDDSISFDVSRTGVPVVVRESWFPNWEAEGADGPYRATPNQMVVVPTSKHVTLQFGTTTAEWLGRLGTLVGLVGLGLLVWWPIRRRRRGSTSEPSNPEPGVPEPGVPEPGAQEPGSVEEPPSGGAAERPIRWNRGAGTMDRPLAESDPVPIHDS